MLNAELPASTKAGPPRPAASIHRPKSGLPTVLVVDANPCMRELLRLHLSNAGYQVIAAEDAVMALKLLLRCSPDLVIVDADLPYMNGLELVETLKRDPDYAIIPVLFLTARRDTQLQADRCGAAACLGTPLFANELISAVMTVLPNGRIPLG